MKPYRHRRSRHTPAGRGGSWIKPQTRWAIYLRDGFCCVYCGAASLDVTIDHTRAVQNGGRNDTRYLVTCCRRCNSRKQGLTMRQWLGKLRAEGLDMVPIRRRLDRARRSKLYRREALRVREGILKIRSAALVDAANG